MDIRPWSLDNESINQIASSRTPENTHQPSGWYCVTSSVSTLNKLLVSSDRLKISYCASIFCCWPLHRMNWKATVHTWNGPLYRKHKGSCPQNYKEWSDPYILTSYPKQVNWIHPFTNTRNRGLLEQSRRFHALRALLRAAACAKRKSCVPRCGVHQNLS